MHFSPYMGKKGWRFKRPPTNAIFLLSLILPVAKKHSFRVGKHSKRKEISSANKTPSTSNLNAQLVSGHFCSHRSTVEKYPWEISPSFLPFPYLWVSLLILCFQKVLVSFTAEWTKESPSNALPWSEDPSCHGHHGPKAFPIFSHLPSLPWIHLSFSHKKPSVLWSPKPGRESSRDEALGWESSSFFGLFWTCFLFSASGS